MYAVCKDGEYKYIQYIRTVYIQTNCMTIDIALRDHLIQDTPHGAVYTLTIRKYQVTHSDKIVKTFNST